MENNSFISIVYPNLRVFASPKRAEKIFLIFFKIPLEKSRFLVYNVKKELERHLFEQLRRRFLQLNNDTNSTDMRVLTYDVLRKRFDSSHLHHLFLLVFVVCLGYADDRKESCF